MALKAFPPAAESSTPLLEISGKRAKGLFFATSLSVA